MLGLAVKGLSGWVLAAHAWWAVGTVVLAFIDAAAHRLPHRITAVTTAGLFVLLTVSGEPGPLWRAAFAAGTLTALLAVIAVTAPRHLGLGDVTFAFPIGAILAWHSWTSMTLGLAFAVASASGVATARRIIDKHCVDANLPLGSHLAIATLVAVLVE